MEDVNAHFCRYKVWYVSRDKSYKAGSDLGFFSPRLAYILRGRCRVVLYDGSEFTVNEGDVWFVPKGKSYTSYWSSNDNIEFIYYEFDADFVAECYDTFQTMHYPGLGKTFRRLCDAYLAGEKYAALSAFYEILSAVLPLLEKTEISNITTVMPALDYINAHYAETVKVEKLASLCFLSPSRFYDVFKQVMGVSPIEYKNTVKLSRAENLIRDGVPLEKICDELNFSNPAFLRRLLKSHLGKSPKEIKKEGRITL